MALLIVGVFRGRDQAEGALRELRDQGFDASDIGLALRGGLAQTAGKVQAPGSNTFAWIPDHRVASLQGIGNALIAGTIADCIDREFPGQAQANLTDALTCLGVRREHAEWYDEQVRDGKDLVIVRTDSRGADAQAIMERFGTLEVPSRDRTPGEAPNPRSSSTSTLRTGAASQSTSSTSPSTSSSSRSTTSQGAADRLDQVKAGFDVYSSDGHKVGTVQEASPQCVHVLCCSNLFVQASRVKQVTNDSVVLNVPRDQMSNVDWSSCHPSHQASYAPGGPGYSGLPPQEHEPGVRIPVENGDE
ncbi:MAG: hypothetical protein ACRDIY_00725 [Chloroflexota bacterium]